MNSILSLSQPSSVSLMKENFSRFLTLDRKIILVATAIFFSLIALFFIYKFYPFSAKIDPKDKGDDKPKIPQSPPVNPVSEPIKRTNVNVENVLLSKKDRYEGNKVNGKAHGKGTYIWANGDEYTGKFIEGKRTGKGTFTQANGNKIKGYFIDDKLILGKKTYVWPNKRSGKIEIIFPNRDKFEGQFKDDKRTGKGIYSTSNGDNYEADFVNGEQTGKVTITYANKDKYEGEVVKGKLTGIATITYSNKATYVGEIDNLTPHGKGKYIDSKSNVYEGNFVDGKLTGKGTVTYPSGAKYVGDLVKGSANGRGKYIEPDGTVSQEGDYEQGQWVRN